MNPEFIYWLNNSPTASALLFTGGLALICLAAWLQAYTAKTIFLMQSRFMKVVPRRFRFSLDRLVVILLILLLGFGAYYSISTMERNNTCITRSSQA